MGIKYEIVASNGTYTNKAGEEKKRWVKLGVVLENERGMSLKFESVPVGWDGWAILSEPRERNQASEDSDIPF